MSSFAYSVAIKLSVANLASQGVRALAKDLMMAHGKATDLQNKLKALKMIAVGYGVEKVGQGMLGFMGKAVDASKEYTHQIALMNAAGFTHREIAQSIASAWKTTSSVITSTAQDNLATIRELRTSFGAGEGMQHAYAVLPQVQRAAAIMRSITGKDQTGVGFDMVKAIEFATKGAITVPEMSKQMEMMTKALVQMNGTLTVGDFHQTLKATKSMAPYMTDDFKYTILPTLMQEFKSHGGGAQMAGTALATLTGTIKGHAIQKKQMQAWIDAGLINPSMVVRNPHERNASKILPGAIGGENLFTQNPLQWAVQYLIPARDRLMKKYHVDDLGAYYSLTGNRNSAFMMQTLANKGPQFARDASLIRNGPSSYDSYQRLLKLDPEMAEQAMHNQWQNLLAIIGYQILPKIIPFMVKFADALNGIATFAARHPTMASTIAIGFTAIGGALDLAGKAIMFGGILKLFDIAKLLRTVGLATTVAVEGGEGTAGIAGLAAALGAGSPFVIALGIAAAAIAGVTLAAKLLGGSSKTITGDVNATSFGRAHQAIPLHFVIDRSGHSGMFGHYEGVGSGAKNASGIGLNGYRVSADYYSGVNPVPTAHHQPIVIHHETKLDGKVLYRSHQKHLHRHLRRPSTGSSTHDPSMGAPSVAGAQ